MKLRIKLIIAFTSIVILMGLVQSAFFQNRLIINFENYINKNETMDLVIWEDTLLQYYTYYGSWNDVQTILNVNQTDFIGRGPKWGSSANFQNRMQIIVADEKGIIVADTEKKYLSKNIASVEGIHQDLKVNGKKIGELVVLQKNIEGLISLEQQFKASTKNSIIYGMMVSIIIAILLGIFFSNRITRPLNKLMDGIKHLSKGDTSYRVEVETRDEFHQLATAFNEMSIKIEENEQIRKNLMADVAHELRTPISIIGGELESIQEGVIEPSQEILVNLSDEVYRLSRLINDLQQLSLAEAGSLTLNKTDTNIFDLTQRVINNFEWIKEDKNISFSITGDKDIEANIDSDRMTQVIINLVGNALRHVPENGSVNVKINEDLVNNKIYIAIEDNGPGIPKEQIKHIFDRFYRTDISRSRDQGGTGLGLSIAKGYVEAHGGNITIESELNKSTVFTIDIPSS